jgi:ectoine hydroxylase-related dioxygenase (phytanoyl-CoA dioxygenase family)
MWSMLRSQISDKNIDALMLRAETIVTAPNSPEFVAAGKTFFKPRAVEDNNLDLLKQIHSDVWPEISQRMNFDEPVIDHSYLLFKSAGGVETKMHQDRVYWERKEAQPSIISVWIALEDLSVEKGGLLLSRENEVTSKQWSSFNTGAILSHEEPVLSSSSSFSLVISEAIAHKLRPSMEFIPLRKGEGLVFDSFEPHMSGANQTEAPRLVIKLAYAEAQQRRSPSILISLEDLKAFKV